MDKKFVEFKQICIKGDLSQIEEIDPIVLHRVEDETFIWMKAKDKYFIHSKLDSRIKVPKNCKAKMFYPKLQQKISKWRK